MITIILMKMVVISPQFHFFDCDDVAIPVVTNTVILVSLCYHDSWFCFGTVLRKMCHPFFVRYRCFKRGIVSDRNRHNAMFVVTKLSLFSHHVGR